MYSNTEVMLEGSINEDGRDLYDGATEDMEYSCDDNNVEQSESESYDEEGDDEDPGTDDASLSDESIHDMDYEQNDTDCYDDLEEPYGDYQDEDMSNNVEDRVAINSLNDILAMDLKNLVPVDMINYDFLDSDVAYLFYHWYGRANGFAVRKSRKVHSIDGILLQQNYVCHREGKREDRGVTLENRKQKQRVDFRCGCNARFRVHIDAETQRWYVKLFNDEHTHELVEDETCGMIAAYRKMTDTDILHMNNMLKVGIRTPQIHSSLASQTGGYMKVSCSKKGMYNVQARERRVHATDAGGALEYMRGLVKVDPLLYWRHKVDEEGNLEHLFWADGVSQLSYKVFGDVVAFDATYGKNRYKCPFVVFSGVNHHNKSTIFGAALVSNEKEETYTWLLECFLEAMSGKAPSAVITDGDIRMRNAIKKVFPRAYHRLCAWHLLKNSTDNLHIAKFTKELKRCMFDECSVVEFEQRWDLMVDKFGLQDNPWVRELYERRKMWAAAIMIGHFFAGFRTTSRCEALHSQIGKFVNIRYSLVQFVQHFQRCLNYLRYKEIEADFKSSYGNVVCQTQLRSLERSASNQFTLDVFELFKPALIRAAVMKVVRFQETLTCTMFIVSQFGHEEDRSWHVSYDEETVHLGCSCLKMETKGLPCEHIVAVLVFLGITEVPKSLVLDRWSKSAKDSIRVGYNHESLFWDSHRLCQYSSMVDQCHHMCNLSLINDDEIQKTRDMIFNRIEHLKLMQSNVAGETVEHPPQANVDIVGNPVPNVRNAVPRGPVTRFRRAPRCSRCKNTGHNIKSCREFSHAGTSGGGGVPLSRHNVTNEASTMDQVTTGDETYPVFGTASTTGTQAAMRGWGWHPSQGL